jgi:hypothetical protein
MPEGPREGAGEGRRFAALLFGRVVAALGLVLGIVGVVSAFLGPVSLQSALPPRPWGSSPER